MQRTFLVLVIAGFFAGCCTADTCQDNRNDCQRTNCTQNGLEWSIKNCIKTCNYCNTSCHDYRDNCLKTDCTSNGLLWSVQNCAKTCNHCSKTKCVFTKWKDVTSCTRSCGGGIKHQIRSPTSVIDVPAGTPLPNVGECYMVYRPMVCNVKSCPTNPPPQHEVQHSYVPAIKPEHVAAVAGTAAATAAVATIGATIGETLLGLLPALAFGKRSSIEERDVLDVFIRKIQEKRDAMK